MDIYCIVQQSPFFAALSDEDAQHIIEYGIKREIAKGTIIHTPDDVCSHITVVIDGRIHSSNYSIQGKEQIVCSFHPGQVFGFPVVFGDLTYPEHIIAETDCMLLYITRDVLLQLFDNKDFLMAFIHKLAHKIKDFSQLVEVLSYTSVRERIGHYLLRRIQECGGNHVTLDRSKTRLAKEMGTSRVVVSRTFKALEDEGIVQRDSETDIIVLDVDALANFS